MATKKSSTPNERIYTIPLRREFIKVPSVKRANRAVKAIKSYVSRHTKTERIFISQELNEMIWERGIHKPPARVRVKAVIESDGVARVGLPEERPIAEREKGRLRKMKERIARKAAQEEKAKKEAEQKVQKELQKTEQLPEKKISSNEEKSREKTESPKQEIKKQHKESETEHKKDKA